MSNGYEALRQAAAWLDLDTRGRIVVRGRDRARLLHNISSNEVKKMAPGDSCYAFLLSPQGRIQADFRLLCFPDHFLIDSEPDLRGKVLQHIKRYIIADQVELEDVSATMASIGVEGPAAASIQLPPGDHSVAPFTVTGQPGFRIYCSPQAKPVLIHHLELAGVGPASAEDARMVRIENGQPRYGDDIQDSNLIQETQQMQAVSFNKGCYIGQEIVERVRAQGQVHRKLQRLELEGTEVPAPGTKLSIDGHEATVTSAIFSPHYSKVIALAYVR